MWLERKSVNENTRLDRFWQLEYSLRRGLLRGRQYVKGIYIIRKCFASLIKKILIVVLLLLCNQELF